MLNMGLTFKCGQDFPQDRKDWHTITWHITQMPQVSICAQMLNTTHNTFRFSLTLILPCSLCGDDYSLFSQIALWCHNGFVSRRSTLCGAMLQLHGDLSAYNDFSWFKMNKVCRTLKGHMQQRDLSPQRLFGFRRPRGDTDNKE